MLKKMQRRFIMAAMAAFATVMLMLVVGINIVNYYRTTSCLLYTSDAADDSLGV